LTRPRLTAEGTTPPGTRGEVQAAQWVQGMFAEIAPRYDLLNHLLSFNIDRAWRKKLLLSLEPVLQRPEARILDLCCGTGDVLLDLQRRSKASLIGADFCHPMLVTANRKAKSRGFHARLMEADALELPLAQNSLDAISIAFGFRNLTNYRAGLLELHRTLKPGGMLAILEFSHPPGWFMKAAYGFYSAGVLPLVGALVSGSRTAYSYLPESVSRFPQAEELRRMLESSGFEETKYELLTGGIAALHTGTKLHGVN
jgi:demethylmenaquinone methyltransferase / 2-methoxy-6-polyprenyl-1,4-benzoquinol methylase